MKKYQDLVALLTSQITNRQNMSIITNSMPSYVLPNPVPAVADNSCVISGNRVNSNLEAIPPDDLNAVRYGVLQAIRTVFPGAIQYRNAYWPVTLPVRIRNNIQRIRYELVFDNDSNIRVERLGAAILRTVPPAFAALNVNGKKAALLRECYLSGSDDRRALPAQAAGHGRTAIPAQAAANRSSDELDPGKTSFDLLPQSGKGSLDGVARARGRISPYGANQYGFSHTSPNAIYDQPNPPTHNSPHIHYYDSAFTRNNLSSGCPPYGTGPISEWMLTYEVCCNFTEQFL
ncbi:MAG: hypothetical protein ACMUJM_16755 [bacterium]